MVRPLRRASAASLGCISGQVASPSAPVGPSQRTTTLLTLHAFARRVPFAEATRWVCRITLSPDQEQNPVEDLRARRVVVRHRRHTLLSRDLCDRVYRWIKPTTRQVFRNEEKCRSGRTRANFTVPLPCTGHRQSRWLHGHPRAARRHAGRPRSRPPRPGSALQWISLLPGC
jgi:hypothetical protein